MFQAAGVEFPKIAAITILHLQYMQKQSSPSFCGYTVEELNDIGMSLQVGLEYPEKNVCFVRDDSPFRMRKEGLLLCHCSKDVEVSPTFGVDVLHDDARGSFTTGEKLMLDNKTVFRGSKLVEISMATAIV